MVIIYITKIIKSKFLIYLIEEIRILLFMFNKKIIYCKYIDNEKKTYSIRNIILIYLILNKFLHIWNPPKEKITHYWFNIFYKLQIGKNCLINVFFSYINMNNNDFYVILDLIKIKKQQYKNSFS